MPVDMDTIVEETLQQSDSTTVLFYKNGFEGKAFHELSKLLESVTTLFELLLQSTEYEEIVKKLSALFTVLNSSLELDDMVKICDLLNFELRPLLLTLGGRE